MITAYDISQLVGEAWPKALTPENLISVFLHSGIYPLCLEKITAKKLAPSASTHHSGGKTIDQNLAVPKTGKGERNSTHFVTLSSNSCVFLCLPLLACYFSSHVQPLTLFSFLPFLNFLFLLLFCCYLVQFLLLHFLSKLFLSYTSSSDYKC